MDTKLKNSIDFELRKKLTDAICVMGSNIGYMKTLLKSESLSKKEMRKALKKQLKYLQYIEQSKNNILFEMGCHTDKENKIVANKTHSIISFKCSGCGKVYQYIMGENCPFCGNDEIIYKNKK